MTEDNPDTTESTATRWEYTNDVLAGIVIIGFFATVFYGIRTGAFEIDTSWFGPALVLLALLAGAWLFGDEGIQAIKQFWG